MNDSAFPALSALSASALLRPSILPIFIQPSIFHVCVEWWGIVNPCPCNPGVTAHVRRVVSSLSRFPMSRLIPFPVGCSTCRRRKVKCGEEKPICGRCSALRLNCEWGVPVKRGRSTQIRHLEPAPSAPEQWHLPKFEDLVDTQQDLLYTSLSPVSWAGDFVPFDTTQLTSFRSTPIATPIYPSLNFNNVACANSLALNALDLQYFQYFPSSSLVYYYMKGWKWSSFW
jgi:hypothetical protein